MRIDYFLVSRALVHRVSDVKVFGSGADRKGFLGSDHCPLLLTLREVSATGDPDEAPTTSEAGTAAGGRVDNGGEKEGGGGGGAGTSAMGASRQASTDS